LTDYSQQMESSFESVPRYCRIFLCAAGGSYLISSSDLELTFFSSSLASARSSESADVEVFELVGAAVFSVAAAFSEPDSTSFVLIC